MSSHPRGHMQLDPTLQKKLPTGSSGADTGIYVRNDLVFCMCSVQRRVTGATTCNACNMQKISSSLARSSSSSSSRWPTSFCFTPERRRNQLLLNIRGETAVCWLWCLKSFNSREYERGHEGGEYGLDLQLQTTCRHSRLLVACVQRRPTSIAI